MSTKRELTLAQRDLHDAASALLRANPMCGQDWNDAWQGLEWSLNHLDALMADLDGDAPASARDTSIATSKMILPAQRSLRRTVLNSVIGKYTITSGHDGLTCDQIERQLRRPHTSVSSAVNYLENHGFIRDSGVRRNTVSGYPAIVYIPSEAALAVARDFAA